MASLTRGTAAAIDIRGLTKEFRIPTAERELTIAEQVLRRLRQPWRRESYETLAALDIDELRIEPGEAIGLIGRNGAGKSTLLKVLSRVTPPTTGSIAIAGRVGSLLEVGTGFHPELTGRENIYLSGAILGMRRAEIRKHFDSIVEFAGVAKFLDLPVKRFSSGMYVRLAFAVAAHLEAEVLLVDEVLAVGDADFQALSSAKMREVVKDGRTVILVSHQMRTISDICTRGVLLDRGSVRFDGSVPEAVSGYIDMAKAMSRAVRSPESQGKSIVISSVEATKPVFQPGESKGMRIRIAYDGKVPVDRYFIGVKVRTADGQPLAHCDSNAVDQWYAAEPGSHEVVFTLEHPWLLPGEYSLDVALCNAGVLDEAQQACWFSVDTELPYPSPPELEIARRDAVLPAYAFGDAERADASQPS